MPTLYSTDTDMETDDAPRDEPKSQTEVAFDLVQRPIEALNDCESNFLMFEDQFALLKTRFAERGLSVTPVADAIGHLRDAHRSVRLARGVLENAGGARR